MMDVIVSISGLDNVGKTTQTNLLQYAVPNSVVLPPLHKFNKDTWEKLPIDWWFNSKTEEHTNLIYDSNKKRYEFSTETPISKFNSFYILDRGAVMFKDVCIAKCMLKDKLDRDAANRKVISISSENWSLESSEFKILLLYSDNIQESVKDLLSRQTEYSEQYFCYQTNLYTLLKESVETGNYDYVIYTKDKSIIEVQNLIRTAINDRYDTKIKLFLENVKTIWAIGGLSECGKSYMGEYLRKKHNFIRLKIGYLIEQGTPLEDIHSIYDDSDNTTHLFMRNLDIFSFKNRDFENYVVESLHRIDFSLDLKKFLGKQVKLVYIDVPLDLRIKRSCEAESEILAKDRIKIERGAEKVSQIADAKIENNYSIIAFENKISSLFIKPQCLFKPKTIAFRELPITNYQNELEAIFNTAFNASLEEIKLIAIIGSAYEGNWMSNWSDLDIFIIGNVNSENIKIYQSLYYDLQSKGIKIGITLITMEEIYSDVLTHHIKNNIQKIYSGKIKPIFSNENILLPNLENNQFNSVNKTVLSDVLIALRRLIICDKSNIRQIYKHIVLLLKILCDDYQTTNISVSQLQNKFNEIYSYNINLPNIETIKELHLRNSENNNLTIIAINLLNFIQKNIT